MKLIDISPFESLSPTLCISYIGKDRMRHTIYAPLEEIPEYRSSAPMPDYLISALKNCSTPLPEALKSPAKPSAPGHCAMTIEDLDLSVRSYNCLMRAGIKTLDALLEMTREDLIKLRNLGATSLKEILSKLDALNLSLKESAEE